jgi:hypothetical protein
VLKLRLALCIATIVVAALLIEVGLRFASPIPESDLLPLAYDADRVEQIASNDTYIRFDQLLGWAPAPSFVRRSGGQTFRTNSVGMRADQEYPLDTRAGLKRLAAFGDSFTYCAEVTQDACWVPQTEKRWPDTEILNYGVPGYGPDQAWLRYQRDGRQYHPCGVLIGYFAEDIDRVVNRFRPFLSPGDSVMMGKPRFLLDGAGLTLLPNPVTDPVQLEDSQWVEQNLGPHDAWYFPGTFIAGPFDSSWLVRLARTAAYQRARSSLLRDDQRYPLYDPDQEAYTVTERILSGFAQQVRDDGATPIIVILPGQRDLEEYAAGVTSYGGLISQLSDEGNTVVDLTDVLAQDQKDNDITTLFAEGRHYSKRGNGIVAQYLSETLPPLVAPTCRD